MFCIETDMNTSAISYNGRYIFHQHYFINRYFKLQNIYRIKSEYISTKVLYIGIL